MSKVMQSVVPKKRGIQQEGLDSYPNSPNPSMAEMFQRILALESDMVHLFGGAFKTFESDGREYERKVK